MAAKNRTFGERVLAFNRSLELGPITLPEGIGVMNPFRGEHADLIARVTAQFYGKYYADARQRFVILGINPGRLGAGQTGVPFTDTKRLLSDCGIEVTEISCHEPSSVFVYEVVRAFGGAAAFYRDFYIHSICPLGFVKRNNKGRDVNYNYYDQKDLQEAVTPFILRTLREQIGFGLNTEVAFCMGTGKNYTFMKRLNDQHGFFGKLIPLEHPRYVIQYRSKRMPEYVKKYLDAFAQHA
ncbi:MAG: uracil-DNA glycosylase family protein, partial [Bacteroidota bacterium]